MEVVLDSTAWYAFVSKEDKFHLYAVEFLKNNPKLILPYTVFEELVALLHHRKGKSFAKKYLSDLRNLLIAEIVYLDLGAEKEIWRIYIESSGQIDYVDASVIWLTKKLELPVFSFDSHFKKLGLNLVPLL